MSNNKKINTRSPGISYQELIKQDKVSPPDILTLENRYPPGTSSIPINRYTDREFHNLEMEKIWTKIWQMACREEEIPNTGDYIIYEIGIYSIIIVNTGEEIKAHRNVCRHRGRQLCDHDGNKPNFTCPFHGFSWNLDGTIKRIISQWDFPEIDKLDFNLSSVRCESWGGWIFINMDNEAESLLSFLGELPEHFKIRPPEERYIQAHVAKVMDCNWKTCQEAFMEALHIMGTHPQALGASGDENSQFDVWGNFARGITAYGTESPRLEYKQTEQELYESMLGRAIDDKTSPNLLPKGVSAREYVCKLSRENTKKIIGNDIKISDAEIIDTIYYNLFPNFHPWAGWGDYSKIVYRFRPLKDRHDKSIMECYFLSPFNGERPTAASIKWLEEDEPWTNAPELGVLAKVFQQDSFNLPKVQKGLNNSPFEEIKLSNYQESKIRHWHDIYTNLINES